MKRLLPLAILPVLCMGWMSCSHSGKEHSSLPDPRTLDTVSYTHLDVYKRQDGKSPMKPHAISKPLLIQKWPSECRKP